MGSTSNLRSLGSLTVSTLYQGSLTERFILGAALVGTGLLIMHTIYSVVSRIFTKKEASAPFPRFVPNPEREQEIRRRLEEQFPVRKAAEPSPQDSSPLPDPLQPRSLITVLSINGQPLGKEQEVQVAEALHTYEKLKKEIKGARGDEGQFVFLVNSYLQAGEAGLPRELEWKERDVRAKIPPHLNDAFAQLQKKLGKVGLSLSNVNTSSRSIANASFRSGDPKDVFDLNELYNLINLHSPHILSEFKIDSIKKQLPEAKQKLHESRLKIIDKTLSIINTIFLNDLVSSFSGKYQDIYAIFGEDRETLRFVLENICWHALDRVLERIEAGFIPSAEGQIRSKEQRKSVMKIDLQDRVKRVFQDEQTRSQAQGLLVQVLEPNNDAAVDSFVKLLSSSVPVGNPEREVLIKSVQDPELQLVEATTQHELARLEVMQSFYDKATIGVAIVDEGKNVLIAKKEEDEKQEKVVFTAIAAPPRPASQAPFGAMTYGAQIDTLSRQIVLAGENGVKIVANQGWENVHASLNEKLQQLNEGLHRLSLPPDTLDEILRDGWVNFRNRQALIHITGEQRWLLTKKMIFQRVATDILQQKGHELVQGIGKGVSSFVKTAYGRLITALLAFDIRTRDAQKGDPKPADRIARAFLEAFQNSFEALTKAKKYNPQVGQREKNVVAELVREGALHPSASNKPSADAVFLGKLILELLSVLQPEGLTEDVRKILVTALSKPGELEPSLIKKAIEFYTNKIRPGAGPLIKPIGTFLIEALQYIIERQSTHNFATQLSDLLDPANINAALVDFLNPDKAQDKTEGKEEEEKKITITPKVASASKERVKWYQDDEDHLKELLETRVNLEAEITAFEKRSEELKKAAAPETLTKILGELAARKFALAKLDLELVPELLRRLIIANAPYGTTAYAMQFVIDIFELIQYPSILRHIVFHVLEKSIYSLATPLEENQKASILDQPIIQADHQSIFDLLFSDLEKTNLGNILVNLFGSISAESDGSYLGSFVQVTAKKFFSGHFLFTRVQRIIEGRIQKKYKDPQAINGSVAKLVVTLTAKIQKFAEDPTEKGMTARIATQLKKVIGMKEKEEPALLS